MRTNLLKFAFAALCLSTFGGCNSGLLQSRVKEGVIEYALTFPDYDPNSLMAGMLPEKTTVSFTKDQQVAELSAGMGVFRTTLVADNKSQQGDYHLSVLSKKIVAHLQDRDMALFTRENEALTIMYTDQTDTVAGFPCKKAVAIFQDIHQPEVDLWYTDAIQMENPNWFSPFKEIPGVLLRYEIVQNGMRMQLDAVSVTPGPVEASKFTVKNDHEKVEPAVLHHELDQVLSTFSL